MTFTSQNQSAERLISLRSVLFVLALVIGPCLMLWHLHRQWSPDGEYAYAWVVPLLTAFLLKSRYDDRPAPSDPVQNAALLVLVLAFVALPSRWLQEAAPERSPGTCTYALACVGSSLGLITLAGGISWLRWFGFPLLFLFTTVPWPHTLENFVSAPLMRGTAGATVEILCLIGIPSLQSGHLVHIETGVLDISEACSGVRSLQAMVMISLFLGELFRFRLSGRFLLLLISLGVTLMANVIRTVVLAGIGFSQGMSAVDSYHDIAGFSVLALSLLGTLAAAYMLRPAKTNEPVPQPCRTSMTFPFTLSIALLLWFCISEISVETWYRLREPAWQGWNWSVQWPKNAEAFQLKEIPRRSLQRLVCDESQAATWRESDGTDWTFYWMRWNPGNPAAETAKAHRPDLCLTAEGAVLQKDTGLQTVSIEGMQIPFHGYTFLMGEKTLRVFFAMCEERPGNSAIAWNPQFESADIFQRALKGWRLAGEQSLEIAVSGYRSEQEVQKSLKKRLGQLIQIRQGAVTGAKE